MMMGPHTVAIMKHRRDLRKGLVLVDPVERLQDLMFRMHDMPEHLRYGPMHIIGGILETHWHLKEVRRWAKRNNIKRVGYEKYKEKNDG